MADNDDDETPIIVIDNGSAKIKAGLSNNENPQLVFPSIIGRPRHTGVFSSFIESMNNGTPQRPYFVGNNATHPKIRGIISSRYPIQNGIVSNWDDMEQIWHYILYKQLKVQPDEHISFLTESPMTPKSNREKMTQIFFETFNVLAFYTTITPILTLYSTGKLSGICVESGDCVTHIAPIFDGVYQNKDVSFCNNLNIGGRNISEYLLQLLNERGLLNVSTQKQKQVILSDIITPLKETQCFISTDCMNDVSHEYELPDGQKIAINTERYCCTEILFKPQLIGIKQDGIHEIIFKAIRSCDEEIKNEMYSHIVFGGGNTLLKGFEQRVKIELDKILNKTVLINGYIRNNYQYCSEKVLYKDIVSLMNRYCTYSAMIHESDAKTKEYSAWIGASVLASVSTFSDFYIRHDEYDEVGPSIVHRRCIC
eukprot:539211_1